MQSKVFTEPGAIPFFLFLNWWSNTLMCCYYEQPSSREAVGLQSISQMRTLEAQRGEGICSGLHSWQGGEPGLTSNSSQCQELRCHLSSQGHLSSCHSGQITLCTVGTERT